MLRPEQVRMARGFLAIDKCALAAATGIATGTLTRIELGKGSRSSTLEKLEKYFAEHGLILISPGKSASGGYGIRLAK